MTSHALLDIYVIKFCRPQLSKEYNGAPLNSRHFLRLFRQMAQLTVTSSLGGEWLALCSPGLSPIKVLAVTMVKINGKITVILTVKLSLF